ncbi:MAG: phospholipase D family protein [Pseudomonadota bacterium]|nr:phospholipase D family protein [Pseudomonadota bacterium]
MLIRLLKKLLKFILLLAVVLVAVAWLSHRSLPDNSQRPASQWLAPNPAGVLAGYALPLAAAHPGQSGVYPLGDGREAFLARLALAEAAQYSLDVQYYIWHDDVSGRLLLQSLYRAAERGVRVRLLLDDNNTKGMDALLAAFDAHPNAELRLFNPFMQRDHRLLGYLSDFARLNRRMHNKSFSADGAVSIVGGRNVGDEYFDVGSGVLFADLDVAVTGPAVADVGADFDRYWASESTYPASRILPAEGGAPTFDAQPSSDAATQSYLASLAQSPFAAHLRAGSLPLVWAPATLVSDDPAKGLGQALPQNTVLARIAPVMEAAQSHLTIVSPYFVPTQHGSDWLGRLAQSGKAVTVLTNSLAATDVAPVHAGYAKYRKDLLRQGVRLYELKPDATVRAQHNLPLGGSSGASLHAKTFAVDGRQLFVGSFNMDPRSAALNTEMGLIFDSPALAQQLTQGLQQHGAARTYAVSLNEQGQLHWQTQEDGQTRRFDTEPQSTAFQRAVVWLSSLLPIEHLL